MLNFPNIFKRKAIITNPADRREIVADAFRNPQAIKGRGAPNTKARNWIEFVSDFKVVKLRDYDSYLRAGTGNLWASFKAVETIAKAMVSTPIVVRKKDKVISNENDPLVKLFAEPNPFDSWEEVFYVWAFHLRFVGNAYWLKDEIDGKGRPTHVYPLLPQFVEIVPDRQKRVALYQYRVNGRVIDILPEEMIHFKAPNPRDVLFGLGDLEAAEPMLEDYINRNRLEMHYLKKGGVPSGVLVKKEEVEDEDEWKEFTSKWKEEYEGLDNTGKTAFLNGEWNYVKLGLTPTELQTMQRSDSTVKNIFTLHGVPLSVAGFERAANYATAKQDDIHFKRWTIMPMLDLFCGKLNANKSLARNYHPDYRVGYELGGMQDIEALMREYGPMVDKGALTRNELRKICELEEIKNNPMMDAFLVPQGLVPIEMAGMGGGASEEDLDNSFTSEDDDEIEDEESEEPEDDKEFTKGSK